MDEKWMENGWKMSNERKLANLMKTNEMDERLLTRMTLDDTNVKQWKMSIYRSTFTSWMNFGSCRWNMTKWMKND